MNMGFARVVDKDETILRQWAEERRRLNNYVPVVKSVSDHLYEIYLNCNSNLEIFYCTRYRYLDDIDMFRFENYTSLDTFNGMVDDECLLVAISNINYMRVKRLQKEKEEE